MFGLTPQLIDFLGAHRVGVLATVDEVALPRQSVVYYLRDEQRILISTESKRLKARDVRRSGGPRCASLAITVEAVAAVNYLPTATEAEAS